MPHRGTALLQLAFFLFSAVFGAVPSFAQSLTIQGKLTNSAGAAITGSAVQFKVAILSTDGNLCVLYSESQTLNLSASDGLFSLSLNSGAGTQNAPTTYSLEQAVSNRVPLQVSSSYCASGSGTITYTPAFDAARQVQVQFYDPSSMSAFETIPVMTLSPGANTIDATRVGGYPASALLRVVDGTTIGTATPFTTAQFTQLESLIAGTATSYVSSSTTSGAQLPSVSGAPSTLAAGSIWYDSSSNSVKFYNGSATQTIGTGSGSGTISGVTTSAPLSGSGTTGSVNISLSNSGVTAGSYGGSTAVPVLTVDAFGRVTAASTATISGVAPGGLAGGDLSGSYPSPTVAKIQGTAVSSTAPSSGQVFKYNGTNWGGALLSMSDIYASDSTPVITNAGCTSTQSLYLDSVTGHFNCQSIGGLNASAITTGTLAASVMPAFTGDATSSAGSTSLTLAASGATAGTYKSVTVDAKGRVTAGTNPTTLGGFGITDGVQNTGGLPSMAAGADASKPTAGTAGRLFVASDTFKIYRDNGTSWDVISSAAGSGGTITGVTAGTALSGGGTTGNVTLNLTSVGTAGTYPKVTTDAQGRVTAGSALAVSDIPSLPWSQITSGTPTTLSGYGITNGVANAGSAISLQAGTAASQPAAGTLGRIYIATDTNVIAYDNGTSWANIVSGTGFSGSLSGDVTGAQSSTTVAKVGGVTAANVASGANAANAATNANTASTIIARDSSGNFSASGATLTSVVLKDSGSNTATVTAPTTISTSYSLQLPTAAPSSNGQVLSGTTAGALSWINAAVGTLTGVTAGTGLSGGGTSGNPTLGIANTTVTAGTYGSSTSVPTFTVNAQGQLTAASASTITGLLPSGTSGQFLKYTSSWVGASIGLNDLMSTVSGNLFSSPACTPAQSLTWNSGTDQFTCQSIALDASAISTGTIAAARMPAFTGDATSSAGSTALTLASSGVTAGTYQSVTVDAKGRVTAGSSPTTLSGYGITNAVQNNGGLPSMSAGADASKPAAGTTGRLYVATDTFKIYRDNGTSWDTISSASGSGGTITGVTAGSGLSGGGTTGNVTVSMPSTGTAGTYTKVTTDAYGRVTAGTTLAVSDIPSLPWSQITSGTPTTLSGYGITNGVANAGAAVSLQAGTAASRPSFGTVGRFYVATDTNVISYDTGSAWQTIASGSSFSGSLSGDVTGTQSATVVSQLGGVTAANVASGANLANAATNLNTASTIVKRDSSGNFAAGAVSEGSSIFRDSASNTVTVAAPSTVTTSYSLTLPPAKASVAGQVLSSDTSGVLSWVTPAVTSGVSVTAPITNSGSASAPNIGISQATTSTNGYLSSADWNTFTAKLSNALTSAYLFVGSASNVATGVALSGDATITNAGALTVTGIKGKTVSAAPTTAGQVLRYDGTNITPNFLSMADLRSTVTGSSALTTGCTASQTLTWNSGTDNLMCQSISVAAATQITGLLPIANGGTGSATTSQNYVFAGPSAAGGAPSFRLLTAADMPASASYWVAATGGINYAGGNNVGIGTTSPGTTLDVVGQAASIRGTGTTPGEIHLGPGPTTGANYVGFKGPSSNPASSVLWQLPAADGASNSVLSTNGSGTLSWIPTTTGNITSVGLNGPGGVFSVTGSPLTSNGSITLSTAGTAGGFPYFSTASTLSSSATLTAYGLVMSNGTSAPTTIAPVAAGRFLASAGTSSAPAYTTTPTLGAVGTAGSLSFAGSTSGVVTVQPQAAAGTYNFNLPISAGTSGQALLSAGGGTSPMTWGTLGVAGGGTGLTSGTSGGIPYFNTSTTLASSAALTAHAVTLGGGAATAPYSMAALGTAGNVLSSAGAGADPTWGALNLAGGANYVSGILPIANGGTGAATLTGAGVFVNGGNSFGGAATLGTNDSNSLTLKTNNAAAMTILSGGNVGIGTAAPGAMLDVNAIANSQIAYFRGNTGSNVPAVNNYLGLAANYSNGNAEVDLWNTNDPTTYANTSFRFLQRTHAGTALDLMTINNNGNVGIGTTSPLRALHVANGTSSEIVEESQNVASGTIGRIWRTRNTGGLFYIDALDGPMANATNVMVMNTSGNVGIATTSPVDKLDVESGNIYSQYSSSSTGGAALGASSLGSELKLNGSGYAHFSLLNSAGVLKIGTTSGAPTLGQGITPALSISSTGNVGIGTTSPASLLSVGSTSGNGISLGNSDVASGAWIRNDGVNTVFSTNVGSLQIGYAGSTKNIYLYPGGSTPGLTMLSSGNVGIGTTSPSVALDTVGSIQLHDSGVVDNGYNGALRITRNPGIAQDVNFIRAGNAALSMGWLPNTNTFGFGQGAPTDANFLPSFFSINMNTSNVGIGTTSPSYTLHVVGTAGLSTGTAWTNASDIRLKDVHGDYEYGLAEVLKLHTIRYNYKKKNALNLPSDHAMTGFIAQEVQKVIPDAVLTRKDGYLELNVDPIHWAVVNAVKQLYHQWFDRDQEIRAAGKATAGDIAALKASNEAKTRELASVKAEMAAGKAEIAAQKAEMAALKIKSESQAAELKAAVCELNPKAKICAGATK